MRSSAFPTWLAGTLIGISAGIGVFTFHYAKGASYFEHDPETCANCHIMQPEYDAWIKSSHRSVAGCNDCHAPHEPIPKLAIKGLNGFRHSLMFTIGGFHEPIAITPLNRSVTEQACRHCHADVVDAMLALDSGDGSGRGDVSCIRCHGSVGHPTPGLMAAHEEN